MDSKIVFLSGGGLLAISLIFAAVLSSSANDISLSNSELILEECEALLYNGEDAINLVFMGPKDKSEDYLEYLFSIKPFEDFKESFNAYLIDENSYYPECELYKGQALLCDNAEVRKKAASCPNDFIFVLQDSGRTTRSSARGPTASINIDPNVPQNVIAHEFGHTFANLAEEYTGASIPVGSKNCPLSCENFEGLENDCFEGCSTQNRIRSIENGVMRTLWDIDNPNAPFGTFNEKLIKDEIDIQKTKGITGSAISEESECLSQEYILVEGTFGQNSIDITSKGKFTGCPGGNGNGDYSYSLRDDQGDYLITENFNPNLIFTDTQTSEQNQIDGETYSNEGGNFIIALPSNTQAQNLEIIDSEGNRVTQTTIADAGARPCRV